MTCISKVYTTCHNASSVFIPVPNLSKLPFLCREICSSYTSSTNHFWPLVHVTSNEHNFLALLSSILLTGSECPPSFLGRFDFRVSSSPPASLHNCVTPSAVCLLPCLDFNACRITKQVIRQLLLVLQTSFTFPFCNRKHYMLNLNILRDQMTVLSQVTVHHARCRNPEGLNIKKVDT